MAQVDTDLPQPWGRGSRRGEALHPLTVSCANAERPTNRTNSPRPAQICHSHGSFCHFHRPPRGPCVVKAIAHELLASEMEAIPCSAVLCARHCSQRHCSREFPLHLTETRSTSQITAIITTRGQSLSYLNSEQFCFRHRNTRQCLLSLGSRVALEHRPPSNVEYHQTPHHSHTRRQIAFIIGTFHQQATRLTFRVLTTHLYSIINLQLTVGIQHKDLRSLVLCIGSRRHRYSQATLLAKLRL